MRNNIRVDAARLRPDRFEAVKEWVRSLGVDPTDVRPKFAIRETENGYELHLSRMRRNDAGKLVIDLAIDEVPSEPVVIQLGPEATWPDVEGGHVGADLSNEAIDELIEAIRRRLRVTSRDVW